MNEVSQSFSYRAGETIRLRFALHDQDGNPADATGATAAFVMARRVGGDPVASTDESPATAEIEWVDQPGGVYDAIVAAGVCADLSGTYQYESWVIDGSGGTSNPAHGYISIAPSLL
jgi:hypothetical protein